MFFRPIFLPLGKNSHHVVIFEDIVNIKKFSLFFVYLFKF